MSNQRISKNVITVTTVLLCLLGPLPAAAQVNQAVSDAESWLSTHQNLDGSFGTTPELMPRDSALSVLALLGGDPSSPALANGLVYVSNVPEESTYFRSLRIQALAGAGRSSAQLIDSLFSFRNGQGFGAFGAHETNVFDTALAVQALATDEKNRVLDILPLVDYLRVSQNPDGGWGFLDDVPSETWYTAEVLLALAGLEELSVSSQVLTAATNYLLARQTPDGSFGSVVETALVYRALLARGYDVSTLPASPVTFLLAEQLPNGSWENDHFATAQAVLSLRTQLPNLTVTALSANPLNAPLGTPVTLTATVRNTGPVSTPETTLLVRARTVDGEERGSATVSELASGTQIDVQVTIQTTGDSGNLKLFAIADGRSDIAELDESDNFRSVEIGLRTGPDLVIFAPSLAVSPSQPRPSTAFSLQINAQNLGETAVPSFRYRVARLVAGAPTLPVENTAGPIAAGGSLLIQVPLNLPEGEYTYQVTLDPLDIVDEESEDNNQAEIAFFVTDPARPDFTIAAADLTITPAQPAVGQTATVGVRVKNVGTKNGTALLEIFNGDPAAGGTLIGTSQSVTLNAGATSAVISRTFTVGAGSFFVTAIVDRANTVAELDEANNRQRRVFRDLPDPAVGFDGFNFSPAEPIENDPVQVALTVRNAGTLEATNVLVEVFDGDPAAGGASVFSTRVPSIPAGGNRPVSFSWPAAAGLRRLVTVVDGGGEILEFSEDNNRTEREIAVPRAAGPDLTVAAVDTSGLVHSPATLLAQGTAQVQIANAGDDLTAGAPFAVRLFEDRDGDGRFSTGDQDLGSATVTGGLAEGATVDVPIAVDASLEFHRPLVIAEADATGVVPERREDNNRKAVFGGSCEVLSPASIEPEVEWSVPGIQAETAPVVVQLSDDNGDGRIDSRDTPDVVLHTEDAQGRLVLALSGLGGSRLWAFRSSAANPLQSRLAHLAAADLDGDGVVEIVAVQTNSRLVALDRTGAVRWVSDAIESTGGDWTGGPSIADLTGDGVPEIVVGRAVLSNTGRRIALGTANVGRNYNYYGPLGVPYAFDHPHSIVADVDLDGTAEIVAGDALYRLVNGALTVVWDKSFPDKLMEDGFAAVGNLDGDPQAEIVYVSSNQIMVLNHDGSVRSASRVMIPFSNAYRATFWGGPPTIADITGDGTPEILVAGDTQLIAYTANLGTLWRKTINDVASVTGVTAFDLDGDGKREVIFLDENFLYILNGANGATLHQRKNTSLTGSEYPVVADVDNDGQAEILVPSNRHRNGDISTQGLHVLGNPTWRGTRPIWNQYSYHVTNVGLDGTVPASETPAWQAGNTWRVNQELPRQPRRLPNLTLGLPRVAAATPSGIPVTVRVGNGGRGSLAAGVRVRLYDADPAGGSATMGGQGVTTGALAPGGFEDLTVLWQAPGEAPRTAFAQVDPEGEIEECDEADNGLDLVLTETLLSDLFIPAGGVTAPATAAAGQVVTVSVQVKNVGAAASAAAVVRLYDGEPAQGIVVGEAPLATLAPGATATVPVRWSTLGASGTHAIHAVADGAGAVPEVDETNNEGLAVIQLTAPTLPDLSAETLRVSAAEAAAGEPVHATVTVLNRGTALANGFKVALRVNGAQDGAAVTSAGDLDAGASRDVELTLQTLGRSGVLTLEARLDPLGEVGEQNETNNASPQKEVRILAADAALSLSTDRTSYGPGETATFQGTATNSTATARTLDLRLAVVDSAGVEMAVVASQPVTLAPGANPFSFPWGTGASLPGTYSGVAELREGGIVRARATATFSIARQVDLRARLIADRDVYRPGQSAILTGAVTNESPNQILEGLTARIAVASPSGAEVFATQQTLLQVLPGASLSVPTVWPLGTAVPGSYIASLSVRDAGGKLLAFGSTRLEVEDSAQSGAGLEGRLTVTPRVVAAGAPLVLDFALTNRGNAGLTSLPLRFDAVRLSDGTVAASLGQTRTVAQGATVAGALGLPTAGLPEGDYLVVLVAMPPAGEIRLDSAPFTAVRGISIADAIVAEGDGGTAQARFAVILSSVSDQTVSVTYATSDSTAVSSGVGTDYAAASGTLIFAPGEVEKTVSVDVLGDVDPEIDEVFLVELSAPENVSLGDAQGLGTITDEEGCPGPNLLANPGAEEATPAGELAGWTAEAEAEAVWAPRFGDPAPLAGLASFGALGETAELRQDVDVSAYATRIDAGLQSFAFGGFVESADEPAPDAARIVVEYRDAANTGLLASFDSGELTAPGGWRSVTDERLAPAGTRWVRVRLLAARNSGETTDAGFDRLTLVSAGVPVLRVEDVSLTEGNAGSSPARFRVTLSCPNPAAASIGYTTRAASAAEGSDYEATSGTLPLPVGATEGFIEVPVHGDTTDEADETFFLDLSAPESLVALDATAAGLILDDDGPVVISIDDVVVTEGNAGTAEARFTLTLSAASGRRVEVGYATADGAAVAGTDYQAASGTAVFSPGTTTATIAVAVVGDILDELQEDFALRLSGPVNATLGDAEGEARITDDDEVLISVIDVQVVEGDSGTVSAVFTVTLSVPSVREVSASWATADVTATAPADYTAGSGLLVFAPGTVSKTVSVAVKGELVKEPEETFVVRLSNPVDALLAKPEGVGTILDNDGVLISVADLTVREGAANATAAFKITLSRSFNQPILVSYQTTDGTARAGSDYQALSGTITFAAGTTTQTVNVIVLPDALEEPAESFSFQISNPTNGALILKGTATATVIDSDLWTVNGSANDLTIPGCVVLTPDATNQAGTAWRNQRIDLNQSFDKTFKVFLGLRDGADGVLFGLHDLGFNALGSAGGYLAFLTLSPAVGIEVDTWRNSWDTTSDDHMNVDINGAAVGPVVPASPTGANVEDGKEHDLRVTWNAATKTLDAHFDGNERLMHQQDLAATVFGGVSSVIYGMTAGAGSPGNLHYFCETEMCYGTSASPKISVGDVRVTETNAGGVQAIFPVTLSCPADHPVTVSYATADGTTTGSDYVSASGTVTFAPGETSRSVSVAVLGDTLGELDETFHLDLASPEGGELRYARGTATILTDEVPVSIGDAAVSEGSSGTHGVSVPVTLARASSQALSVSYATADGTAGSADYTAASGTLVFQPGETSKTLTVVLKGDTLVEGDETFFVRLTGAAGVDPVDAEGVVTVLDDDDCPTPNLLRNGSADEPLVDGELPNWTEVVATTWTQRSSSPAPFEGSAYFQSGSNAAAELRQDVDVSGFAERIDAGVQRFAFEGFVRAFDQSPSDLSRIVVEYRNAANAAVLASFDSGDSATTVSWVRIADLRTAPAGTRWIRVRLIATRRNGTSNDGYFDALSLRALAAPSLLLGDVTVTEGNAGTTPATFPITLSCPSPRPVSVDYFTIDGTAVSGSDYQPVSGTLVFQPGEVAKSVTVQVAGDTESESNETFVLQLANPVDAALARAQATATINQDESLASIGGTEVLEGNSGQAVMSFSVTLSRASDQEIRIDYATEDGTAAAGSDYTAASGTLVFTPGQTSKTITVQVIGDTEVEPDETFFIQLSNPVRVALAAARATGLIIQDDLSISIGDVAVIEGNSGQIAAVFNVTLSTSSSKTVTVQYSTADSFATQPADYTAVGATTLTFSPGQTAKTVTVQVKGDTLVEPSETFFVRLLNPANAGILDDEGQGTIADDDDCPSPNLLRNASGDDALVSNEIPGWTEVDRGSGTLWTRRTASPAPANGSAYFYAGAVAEGELRQDVDVSTYAPYLDTGTQRFFFESYVQSAGETPADTAQILVEYRNAANEDPPLAVFDSGELANVGTWRQVVDLRPAPAGTRWVRVRLVSRRNATANNEANAYFDGLSLRSLGTPALTIDDGARVQEGDSGAEDLRFTVRLSCPWTSTVRVDYSTAPGTAQAGADYQAVQGTLSFAPGTTALPVVVPVLADLYNEIEETLSLVLSNESVAAVADRQEAGTIVDDDPPPAFVVRDLEVTEGNAGTMDAVFRVEITHPSYSVLTVDYRTVNGDALAGSDYVARTGQLSFQPGEQIKTVAVSVNGDTADEVDERFYLELLNPVNGVLADPVGVAVVLDDDDNRTCAGQNLARNAGAEDPLTGSEIARWTELAGTAWGRRTASPAPFEGFAYFAAPGSSELGQEAGISGYAEAQSFAYEAFLRTSSSSHGSRVALDFLDAGGAVLTTVLSTEVTASGSWVRVSGSQVAPAGAARLRLRLLCRSTSASQVCFFDNVSVRSTGTRVLWADDLSVSESAGQAAFRVRLSCPDSGEVTAGFTTADGSAVAGLDYQATSGSVTFAPGETLRTAEVPLVEDNASEPAEELFLDLGPVSGAPLARARTIGTVIDEDGPAVDLILCFDGSGSISASEFSLQLGGMAAALEDANVVPRNGSVRISIFQFDSGARQEIPPTLVTAATAAELAARVRSIAQMGGGTNIPACMVLARDTLARAVPPALKRVLDVSTDGVSGGNLPGEADLTTAAGIDVINAIAVGNGADVAALNAMVRPQPAGGPEGFVIVAQTFAQYQSAIAQKIQREVSPDLAVTKTDGRDSAVPGQPVTYTITVTNVGAAPVASVRVTDPLPGIVNPTFTPSAGSYDAATGLWGGLRLDSGQAVTLTIAGTVDPAATGTLTNTVTVLPPDGTNDLDPANNTAADSTQLTPAADLAIAKTHTGELFVGDPATFTLTVSNAGPSAAAGPISVTDALPAGLTFVAAVGDGWTCTSSGGPVGCQHTGPLAPGASLPPLSLQVAVGAQAAPSVTNSAAAAAPTADPNAANNTASDTAPVAVRPPVLTASKTAVLQVDGSTQGEANPGDVVRYEITVANTGQGPATDLVLEDPIPASTVLVDGSIVASAGTIESTSPLRVRLTELGAGSTLTVRFDVRIAEPFPEGVEQIANQGTVRCDELPELRTDDPAAPGTADPTVTPVVAGPPVLTATKRDELASDADGDGVPSPGDRLRYEVTVTNSGPTAATAVVFQDLPPSHTSIVADSVTASAGTIESQSPVRVAIGSLAPGASVTIRFEVQIANPVPVNTREISNQGTVSSHELPPVPTDDPDLGGATDPTITAITAAPKLVAEKTAELAVDADQDGAPSPGDTLAYTVIVRNVGNTSATAVSLSDRVPANTVIVDGSLSVSQGSSSVAAGEARFDLGEIAGGANATAGFRVRIDDPIPARVREISNQGEVTSVELPPVPTDDPEIGGTADPTVTHISAAPVLVVEKTASLFEDADGDGTVSPGDALLYRITVENRGNTAATEVSLSDDIPAGTAMQAGSLQISQGTIVTEQPVQVSLGEIAADAEATVAFQVTIDEDFPVTSTEVANQAAVTAQELAQAVPSDDPATAEPGDPTRTAVFITPDLSIGDVSVIESAGTAQLTVRLSRPGNRNVQVTFATADGSALAGADFTASGGTPSFAPGETETIVTVAITDDLLDEPDEGFTVVLSAPVHAKLVDAEGAVTILDNDEPPVLAVNDVTVEEGDDGAVDAIFTIGLSAPASFEVRVHFATADDTAHTPDDYVGISGDLVLPAGTMSGTVRVQVLGDRLDEADERFVLRLSQAVNALIGDGEGFGTILDDDEAVLSIGDVEVREGDAGTVDAVFPVHLSAASSQTVTVSFSTAGVTATSGTDFVATSGQVSFAAGETVQSLTVKVHGDVLLEPDETFEVTLANAVGAALGDAVAVGTILDDEVCLGGNLVLNPGAEERPAGGEIPVWKEIEGTQWLPKSAPPTPFEGLSSFFSNVTQFGELRQDVDVSAFAGRIDAGLQRFAFSARLRSFDESPPDVGRVVVEYRDALNQAALEVFDSGDVASVSEWREVGDSRLAPAGTRWVRIRLLATRFTSGTNDSFFDAVSLRPLGMAAVSINDVKVYEGDSGLRDALFTVSLSCPSAETVSVSYATADGTAQAPSDYQTRSGSLSFAPGTTSLQVPVPIVGDTVDEPHEGFFLNLTLASGALAVLADPQGRGTIWNDDFCQRSPGYWKNHQSLWPVGELQIGGVWYYTSQLESLLRYSGSDASSILTHHLVATKLNLERGSDPAWGATPSILLTVDQADLFLATHPPGSDPRGGDRDLALQIKNVLDVYNNAGCGR